jgi:hypothetical protein
MGAHGNTRKKFVTTLERIDFWRTCHPSYLNGGESIGVTGSLAFQSAQERLCTRK